MLQTLKNVNSQLWIKVMVPLAALLIFVVGAIIVMNVQSQNDALSTETAENSKSLAMTIEGTLFDALAVGDNRAVTKQLRRLDKNLSDLTIHIFDFEGEIAFSTHAGVVGKHLRDTVADSEAFAMAMQMLQEGKAPGRPYIAFIESEPFMSIYRPIINESRCHHCHGSSRKILGGIQVKKSIAQSISAAEDSRNRAIAIGIVGVIILSGFIYLLFSTLINRPVRRLFTLAGKMEAGDLTHTVTVTGKDEIARMSNSFNRVSKTLGNMIEEIAVSSHGLSDNTSQQAASIEETSATLDEIATMIKKDADNVMNANAVIKKTESAVNKASSMMTNVTQSMDDITSASNETVKIIKNIDEIAFQTNLLSLNAAVEAARAGEAGAGFAVVAGEVRNLAIRSAEAAKNTSGLIEGTVQKIEDGSKMVSAANETFTEVNTHINRIVELIEALSMSAGEQAKGIEQINSVVSDIEKAIQENASRAEDLAVKTEQFKTESSD